MSVPQFMRRQWTAEEVLQLRKLARQNTPAQVIARKLGRSIDSVYVKASREGLSQRAMPVRLGTTAGFSMRHAFQDQGRGAGVRCGWSLETWLES